MKTERAHYVRRMDGFPMQWLPEEAEMKVMKVWWRVAFWSCVGLAVVLLVPAVALASNCSSLDDCWGMARGAAAAAAGAGVAAAAATNGDSGNGSDGGGGGDSAGGGDGGG